MQALYVCVYETEGGFFGKGRTLREDSHFRQDPPLLVPAFLGTMGLGHLMLPWTGL